MKRLLHFLSLLDNTTRVPAFIDGNSVNQVNAQKKTLLQRLAVLDRCYGIPVRAVYLP